MARKVVAVFAAAVAFLVLFGMVARTAVSLVLVPGVGKIEDLAKLDPWLLWPLSAVTLVIGLLIAGSAARRVLRWGFSTRR